MGVVYQATHIGLNRDVALKLLSPELVDAEDYQLRFRREAALLAAQESPHIVAAYDAGELDGWLYIATQYIPGPDLQQYLQTQGAMPVLESLEVILQVLKGLSVAHDNGIVHRDIKPSNVLIRQPMPPVRAYLCDLGISQVIGAEHTKTAGVIGTLGYMAPERHQGQDATFASDVYAVGCLMWALITGAAPYVGTDYRVADAHLHEPIPQLPPSTPANLLLQPILTRSMAKDPRYRYQTAHEMTQAVEQAQTQLDRVASRRLEDSETIAALPNTDLVTELRPHEAAAVAPLTGSHPPAPRRVVRLGHRATVPLALLAVLGVLGVLALVAGAAAAVLAVRDRSSDAADHTISAPTLSSTQPSPTTSLPPSSSTSVAASSVTSAEAPLPAAAPALAGLHASDEPQPCDGQYVIILATSGTSSETVGKLNQAIDSVPSGRGYHPAYLAGADSCRAFQRSDPTTGDTIYNAYLGPYPTMPAACRALDALPSETAWIRRLANPSKVREQCMCITADADLPLIDGAVPSSQSLAIRHAIASVQWAFYQFHLNSVDAVYGNYTDTFVFQVRQYQSRVGLDQTGIVDATTWGQIKNDYCPSGKFEVTR